MPRARTIRYTYQHNIAAGGLVGPILSAPFDWQVIMGRITGVRMRLQGGASWLLTDIRLQLHNGVPGASGRPSTKLYDTGVLTSASDGVDASAFGGSNDDAFWNDSLGEEAPLFHIRGTGDGDGQSEALYMTLDHNSSGGGLNTNIYVEVAYEQMDH